MADHPNVGRLRSGYEAYARGDLATLQGMFADTITFHFLGHTQLSGAYKGLSQVLGYFERLPEIGATFMFEVHDLLADDEHGVALLAGTVERTGERVKQKVVHVFNLDADGEVTEWWNFWEDQEAFDDLLAEQPLVLSTITRLSAACPRGSDRPGRASPYGRAHEPSPGPSHVGGRSP
jgi:uncharacterized protein